MSEELEKLKIELENNEAQLFDVREEDEWEEGHLKDAKFVPLSELKDGLEIEDSIKSLKTYLYCRSGRRVYMAKPFLDEMGFEKVIPLNEGFDELEDFGFESE